MFTFITEKIVVGHRMISRCDICVSVHRLFRSVWSLCCSNGIFSSRWSFILSLWVLLPLFLRRNHYCCYKQDSGLCCSHDNITHDFLFPFLLAKITRGVNVWMISGLHPNYTFVQAMFTVQQRCNKIFSHCIDE